MPSRIGDGTIPRNDHFVDVTLTGNLSPGDSSRVTNSLIPANDNTEDLGTSALRWRTIYGGTFSGSSNTAVDCSIQTGADAGAKLQACITALPSTGGVADCRGLTGAQSVATGFAVTKANVVILFAPGSTWTWPAAVDSEVGLEVQANNVHIYGNGSIHQATRDASSGSFFDYFPFRVRARAAATAAITGFIMEGMDIRVTVSGANAMTVGCVQLRSDGTDSPVTDWRLENNTCQVDVPDGKFGVSTVYGFYGFTSTASTDRLIQRGKFIGNIFPQSDALRLQQCFGCTDIEWTGNISNNTDSILARAIGTDRFIISGNTLNGSGIYIGANTGVASDESLNGVVTGNTCRWSAAAASADSYCLRIIGARDLSVTGNTFVSTHASGATDGIKISSVASNTNKNITIRGNRIAGFTSAQIRNDDSGLLNTAAESNSIGQTAAGTDSPFGGSSADLVHRPTLDAADFDGSDAGAKIKHCITALPSTGGTCDVGFGGTQSAAARIVVNTKATISFKQPITLTTTLADPGQYVGSLFEITSNDVIIEGVGWSTVLKKTGASNQQALISSEEYDNITIRNLKMDGDEANHTTQVGKLYTCWVALDTAVVTSPRNLRSENVEYTGCGHRATDWRGVIGSHHIGNYFHQTGIATVGGTALDGNATSVDVNGAIRSEDAWFEGNLFEEWGDSAIAAPSTKRVHVIGNTLRGRADFGNTALTTESGIDLVASEDVEVTGNVVREIRGSALGTSIDGAGNIPKRWRVSNNVFYNVASLAAGDPRVIFSSGGTDNQLQSFGLYNNTFIGTRLSVGNIDGFTSGGNSFHNIRSSAGSIAVDLLSNVGSTGLMKNFSFVGDTFSTDNGTLLTAFNVASNITSPGAALIAPIIDYGNVTTADVTFVGGGATDKVIVQTARRHVIQRSSADTTAGDLTFKKSRGTNSAPTTAASGDTMGVMQFYGHDGTAYIQSGRLYCSVANTVATNQVPSQCFLELTNSGGTFKNAFQWFQNGDFGFYSDTAFYGGFSHNNTANRVYTMQNRDDTIVGLLDFAAPPAIGNTTPAAGTFTTLTANTSLVVAGGTALTTSNQTGTGSLVLATSPTLVTPVLGVATGTSFQGIVGNVTPAAGTFTTGQFNTSATIGSGAAITKHLSATAALNFASLAALGCEDLTVTVTGAADGDTVGLGVPNAAVVSATSFYYGWVSAADTVTVRYCTLVSGDPPSATFRVDVWKH